MPTNQPRPGPTARATTPHFLWGPLGAFGARRTCPCPHNPKVAGSNPAPDLDQRLSNLRFESRTISRAAQSATWRDPWRKRDRDSNAGSKPDGKLLIRFLRLFGAGLLRCVGEAADGDGQRLCHHLTCPVGDTTKERVSSSRLAATKSSTLGCPQAQHPSASRTVQTGCAAGEISGVRPGAWAFRLGPPTAPWVHTIRLA